MKRYLLTLTCLCFIIETTVAQPDLQFVDLDFFLTEDCSEVFFDCDACYDFFGYCPNPEYVYFMFALADGTSCNGNAIAEANLTATNGVMFDVEAYPVEISQGDLAPVMNLFFVELDEDAQAFGSITITASVDDGMGGFCTDELSVTFADCDSFIEASEGSCIAGSLDQSLNNQVITCTDQIQVGTNGDENLTLAACSYGYVYAYSVWGDPYSTGSPTSQITDWIISDPNTSFDPLELLYIYYGYYYYGQNYFYLANGTYYIQGAALCIDGSGAITAGCFADGFLQFEWIYDSSDPDCGAILGCTDPCYAEYDADATTDDGTCLTDLTGCADVNAENYDATIPISCSDETLCTYTDTDNDNIFDYLEDANNNGDLNDDDTDMDGIPNFMDDDDDNDGVLTLEEDFIADTDMDGILNYLDSDDDGDGLDAQLEDANNDGDLTNDDSDMDGIPNYLDSDDDGDSLDAFAEDVNGDGDLTNDDTDMDGIPNYLDSDDDGDGVATLNEEINANGDFDDDDTDMDGTPNYLDNDDDGDGIATIDEDVDGNGDLTNDDWDFDGIPNYLDNDDDGDTVPTADEDLNGDNDFNNDDWDMDGIPNYLDVDDDGDGQSPQFEDLNGDGDLTNDDTDMDGIPNYLDEDDDGDGVDSSFEDVNGDGDLTNDDTDMDGIPNYIDDDDDGDGDLTIDEDTNGDGDPTNDDVDGDGIPGYLDFDERLVDINDFNEASFQIYPNPNNGAFVINELNSLLNIKSANSIIIYNSVGQSLSYSIAQNQISLSQAEAGVYYIVIDSQQIKFIIE